MIISRLVGEESATKENARRNGGEGRKGREEKPQNNNWRGERSLTPLAGKEGERERERDHPRGLLLQSVNALPRRSMDWP